MRARKKRLKYETVWRVRWCVGDRDFTEEFYCQKLAESLAQHGVHCQIDSFKRVVMPAGNSLMKQIGVVARRKGLGRAITPEDLDREPQRQATPKSL